LFAAEQEGGVSLETIESRKQSIQTKLDFLKESPNEKNTELVSLLQQQRVTLEQFEGLKQRSLELAAQEGNQASSGEALQSLKKELPRSSFIYYQRLLGALLILEERRHDTALLVSSTEGVLADRKADFANFQQDLRRLREVVQTNAPERFSEVEVLEARTELSKILLQYHEEVLLFSKAELSQQDTDLKRIRLELSEVESILEFSEEDRDRLLSDLEIKAEETISESREIDQKLERIEKQLPTLAIANKDGSRLLFEKIKEARSILQQSILSTVQLLEIRKVWLAIQYRYFNGKIDAAEFQGVRRELEQMLDRLEDTLAWKDRKFSLLVNQLVRVYAREGASVKDEVKQLVEEISGLIGEQRETVRFLHWSIERFLAQTRSRFGVREGVSRFTDMLFAFWNFELIVVDDNPITISKVVRSLLLFLLGLLATRYLTRRVLGKLLERFPLRSGVKVAIQSISFYVLLACFGLLALHLVHIPLTIFTLLGGAIAIGVGFGSQNIINNFISGLILLIEQPIRVGDIVEFSGERGTIQRIGARSTLMLTPENLEVVVPNSFLLENSVTNYTLGSNLVRRSILVGVAYGSPTRDVSKLLSKAVESHGKIHKKPAPDIFFPVSAFGYQCHY
jgi:hypothetical protein